MRVITKIFVKILGNLVKLFSYILYLFFPKKRFILPSHAKAWITSKSKSKITKTLWQTNFTARVTLPMYIGYLCNRFFSPTYEYRFMNDADCLDFIRSNYSKEIFDCYSQLQIGAAKADFWRILALQKQGGVYLDLDAYLFFPLEWTIPSDEKEFYLKNNKEMFTNWFLASQSNNPNLDKIIQSILNNIKENKIKNIYDLTGPGIVDKVLSQITPPVSSISYRKMAAQGVFSNKYFQYADKKDGAWAEAQNKIDIIKKTPHE